MRQITKSPAPPELMRWLRVKPAGVERTYAEVGAKLEGEKHSLRDIVIPVLVRDQGGLCAYCMSRISEADATLEHYVAQNDPIDPAHGRELALEWRNWLAVCNNAGLHENRGGPNEHCDKARGNRPVHLRPSSALPAASPVKALKPRDLERYEAERLLMYLDSGQVSVDRNVAMARGFSEREVDLLQAELDNVLNLNHQWLKDKRKQAVLSVIQGLQVARRKAGHWDDELLQAELERQTRRKSDGTFRAFHMAAAYWIRDHVRGR